MSRDDAEQPGGPTAEDASRSGPDAVAAVERAAAGTRHDGVQRPPEQAKPHAAPVEQVRDDPAMTQGRVVHGRVAGTQPTGEERTGEASDDLT